MTEFVNTSAATKSARRARPASLAMVAAVAISSTVPNHITQNDFLKLCSVDQDVLSATACLNLGQFHCESASTEPRGLNHEEASQALTRLLAKAGFNPSRVERTADLSILFQFLGKSRACIDLYPSGELIVLVRKANRDEIHELEYTDSDRAIKLLQDAGVTS